MCIVNSDCILCRPFVDGFCGMGHVYPTSKVGLRQYIRKRGGMILVETGDFAVSVLFERMPLSTCHEFDHARDHQYTNRHCG
jgi:hypothetical protein